ncbi:hypothetical protein rosag_00710 [Roseisolibacter agri]|uniref:DUF3618 domain-containing protein n=2 Tax=Roseisolibacter agri TaxID=2014610 RepID=A0AA37QD59_9BACT|nr:hypothetical protein rosag_00710 [Roseisolibacter agri]
MERPSEWTAPDAAPRQHDEREPDPTELRAGIRETRERLGETLEELGARLNPQHIRQQVKHDIRDATIGRVEHMARQAADRVQETRSSLADTIRENPIPAAMVGIGLGWLFMNRRRGGARSTYDAQYGGAYGELRPYRPRLDAYDTGAYGAGAYDARYAAGPSPYAGGHAGGYAGDASGAMDRVRERASETAHDVAERTQHAAHAAQAVAQQTRTQVTNQVRRVEDRFDEQPLVVGAATLALGLAAGLALPASDREVRLMGDARDRLVDRVKDAAEEAAGKVQHVAARVMDEAQDTAREAARDEGLTGSRSTQPSPQF